MRPPYLLLSALPTALSAPTLPPLNTSTLAVTFGMLVFPGFQALDVFGPLDVLNSLSSLYNLPATIGMHLDILAATPGPVSTALNASGGSFGQEIVVSTTFEQFMAEGRGMDVLHVPGGLGTRNNVSAEIAFMRDVAPRENYILAICTGATIAARTGILDGRRATTNKKSWAWATSTGPRVQWQRTAQWVVDGNVWSSSGVAAGMDAVFAWVGSVYGEDVAGYVGDYIEYRRARDAGDDPFAGVWE
ncbi:class I glutamine amidotransferase-like protein [Bimuria novae-zelandiae CBS 107.79]|uniref:Class I glutamine amidotransferase-like protein n=1 Tax=Bimuria novae-zelandiae CBS 107.79 TaxID=1447943 RepID=A0A6A5VMW8_9PLEO|nr:class I glutamine amidotransferase-like protein [Bimuria novae-zelandiae CBS 107.79]